MSAGKTGPTDEALVERVRDRDGAAFDTLFARYFGRIHHLVARRLGNPAEVEAAVEDVFVQMISALDAFRGEAPFAAWLLALARRTLAQRSEPGRAPSQPVPTDAAGTAPESEPSIAEIIRQRAERRAGVASLLVRARRLLLSR
jgi:RNA polymerase sigma-70 factor (ECF subfamily)